MDPQCQCLLPMPIANPNLSIYPRHIDDTTIDTTHDDKSSLSPPRHDGIKK